MNTLKNYKTIAITSFLIIAPIIILTSLNIEHSLSLSLLFTVVSLWITEVIPLPITALLIPALSISYGLVDPKTAFAPFGNQILFLFLGSFLLAEAMHKYSLDKRMSNYILSTEFAAKSLERTIYVISVMAWFLSMWISNTATCVVLYPICLALVKTLKEQFSEELNIYNVKLRILFTCAFASSIGGIATPVGSPPNLLAMEYLATKGIILNFTDWMMRGVPLSLIMLLCLNLLLKLRFPIQSIDLSSIRNQFLKDIKNAGRIKKEEKIVLSVFLVAVFLWLAPGLLNIILPNSETILELNQRLSMGVVALLCSAVLFVIPSKVGNEKILSWNDARNIDWGTIILFGGGLCLGQILTSTGLAATIGDTFFSSSSNINLLTVAMISVFLGIFLSEIGSNTASAAIIIPILLATFSHLTNVEITALVLTTAYATSFGFALPVATPPNAIIYSSGEITIKEMMSTGIYFDILGFFIMLLSAYYYF